MKKIATTIGFVLLVLTFATAQQRKKETPQYSDDMGRQLEQMQRQMAEQMKKLFGGSGDDRDSTQNFNFSFKNSPFGAMDSTMSQSFGMLFDGKNWQNLSPNGDTSMNDQMRELRERMPDFGKGLNIEDLMKSFGQTFQGGGFPMSPNNDAMPRIQPNDKKRKGEDAKKNGKYETEKL